MDITESKTENVSDAMLVDYLKEIVFTGLQFLSLTSKPEHAEIVIRGIMPIIRRNFKDFTAYDVKSAIEHGIYKFYGDYTKMNPYTIMGWLDQKRKEIREKEAKEEVQEHFKERKDFILCSNGGYAVLLGLIYDEMKLDRLSFVERLKLFDNNLPCPHTKNDVNVMVRESMLKIMKPKYVRSNKLKNR